MVRAFRLGSVSAAAVMLLGCGGGGGGGGETPTGPITPGPNTPSSASVSMVSGTDSYGYENNVFNPTGVTIARNGTVTWVNNSGVTHGVTFTSTGAPANIPSHSSGGNARTFTTSGTFNYVCSNHPTMTGSVTVQ